MWSDFKLFAAHLEPYDFISYSSNSSSALHRHRMSEQL